MFLGYLPLLYQYAEKIGIELTLGDAYADPTINHKHRKGSYHEKRLAQDLNAFLKSTGKYLNKTSDHEQLGIFWESLHPLCVWGGRFKRIKDGNHYSFGEGLIRIRGHNVIIPRTARTEQLFKLAA